jgi:GntR family transcriptional regulator/MocR family aminotransferase
MAMKWTASDLVLALEWAGEPRDRGRRLQQGLRDAVRIGRLGAGEVLPGSRDLAGALGVARGTVVEAYEQLVAQGYLEARTGSGTVVGARADRHPMAQASTRPVGQAHAIDLRPGIPDLGLFPADDWAWALGRAARAIGRTDLGYGNDLGNPFAREAVAAALRRTRAAATTPAEVVLGSGFAQCVSLALGALAAHGARTLAVEDPGDRSVDDIARAFGFRVVGIPVDEEGMDVDALVAAGADAAIVTPAHQAPTGAVLSARRRTALVAWADRSGGWVIEDDYDSEFRYDRQPVGALQGIAPDRILLIGSVSKTHAPAVRLGWVAVPPALLAAVTAGKEAADRGSSALDQYAFGLLLESGRHDRHVRAMRAVYKRRRAALISALAQHAPGLRLTGLAAGFHGVLHLPAGIDEEGVIRRAAERSVSLRGMRGFSIDPPHEAALVIGFGNADEERIADGVRVLGEVAR